MRKAIVLGVLLLSVLAFSCQKPATATGTNPPGTAPAPEAGAPKPAPAADVSPEMQAFMDMLKGKSADVDAALQKYGIEGLEKNDMNMYDLTAPTVVKTETQGDKTIYTMEAKSGMTVRTYGLTWVGGKITTVEDKGMK